jgi:hypothetical protein
VHFSRVHEASDEGNYRKLRKPESHYTKWKSQDGEEDSILLLSHSQGIEMSAIAVTNSDDSDGDLAPLEDL